VVSQDKSDNTVENATDPDDSWTEQLEEAGESQAHGQKGQPSDVEVGSGRHSADSKDGMIGGGEDPQTGEPGLDDVDGPAD
jgi:hypothetical protein